MLWHFTAEFSEEVLGTIRSRTLVKNFGSVLTKLFIVFLGVEFPVFDLNLGFIISAEEVVSHFTLSFHLHSKTFLSISHTFGIDLARSRNIFLEPTPSL